MLRKIAAFDSSLIKNYLYFPQFPVGTSQAFLQSRRSFPSRPQNRSFGDRGRPNYSSRGSFPRSSNFDRSRDVGRGFRPVVPGNVICLVNPSFRGRERSAPNSTNATDRHRGHISNNKNLKNSHDDNVSDALPKLMLPQDKYHVSNDGDGDVSGLETKSRGMCSACDKRLSQYNEFEKASVFCHVEKVTL